VRLEKELTVTQEKLLVIKNQALITYLGMIKHQDQCEEIGFVKIFKEMFLFDMKLESLQTPRMIDS
jgi:hypothetical protein